MADPLFGAGIRLGGAWVAHLSAGSEAGLGTTLRAVPRLTGFAMRTAWRADRGAVLVAAAAQLVQAGAGAVGLLAVNRLLVGLLSAGPTPERVWAAVPALLVVGTVLAAGSLARAVDTAAQGRLSPKVQRVAEQQIIERAAQVELAVLEDGAFHRSLAGAKLGVPAIQQLTTAVLTSCGSLLTIVATTAAVSTLHPLLVPLLLVAVLPQAWKTAAVARWEYASAMKWINQNRQKTLLVDVLTGQGAPAEEVRVHGLAAFLLGHYRRLADALERERTRLARVYAAAGLLADAVGGLVRALTYAALAGLLITETIPLATAGTAVIAVTTVTGRLTALVGQFSGLYTNGLFVADFHRTLEQTDVHAIPTTGLPAPKPAHIAVRDVSFSYPGSVTPALRGVNLDVRRGEIVALVGANGSGKSTLARLLAGLYQPESGTITWNGTDTRLIARATACDRVAWIGQDFHRWPFTARVNTTVGRPDAPDQERLLAEAAAFSDTAEMIAALPDRWETLLAREFEGGVTLSGGQWQRLALARAHFRRAHLLICDEPTAALDPMTETATFEKLTALADDDRAVVLITHRLGSVRYADRIYVLHEGRLVEEGTHDQLTALGGHFATMYRTQRRQYDLPELASDPVHGR